VLLTIYVKGASSPTANWWEKSLGTHINDKSQFQSLMEGDFSNKVVIAEFYMQKCGYCKKFQADWNQIVNDFTDSFEGRV